MIWLDAIVRVILFVALFWILSLLFGAALEFFRAKAKRRHQRKRSMQYLEHLMRKEEMQRELTDRSYPRSREKGR